MAATKPTNAPATRPVPVAISVLLLLFGFMVAVVAVPFLAFQAWYAFTEHRTTMTTIWGTACLVPLVLMFAGTPIATTWTRRRGSTWSAAFFVAAAMMALTAGAGIHLVLFAAAFGGM